MKEVIVTNRKKSVGVDKRQLKSSFKENRSVCPLMDVAPGYFDPTSIKNKDCLEQMESGGVCQCYKAKGFVQQEAGGIGTQKCKEKLQTETVNRRAINESKSSLDEDWLKEKPIFLKINMSNKECKKGKRKHNSAQVWKNNSGGGIGKKVGEKKVRKFKKRKIKKPLGLDPFQQAKFAKATGQNW